MTSRFLRYLRGSLARQLVAGAVIVEVALMSFFVADLVTREAATLDDGRLVRAEGVARMLATSSVSWTLSDDLQGLDELTRSSTAFEGLRYALILSPTGRVLAHSDPGMAGQFVADPIGRSLISSEPVPHALVQTHDAVDFAAPITSQSDGRVIGWAWVSLSREDVTESIRLATVKGVLYILLVTMVATAITWLLARNMTRSLGELAEVARLFQGGNRKVRASDDRTDEIGSVALGLNKMLDAVTSSELAVQRREEALVQVQRLARLGGIRQLFSEPAGEWSKEIYEIFGHDPASPALGADELIARIHPDDRDRVKQALANRTDDVQSLQFTVSPPEGEFRTCWAELRLIKANGVPVGYEAVCQDVTERESGAAQLRQAQKMESVGQLTGGLAHDFNNLLGVIIGNLDFIEDALPERSPALQFSQTALSAALKGADLTQHLLAFSRRQPLSPQSFDVSLLLENLLLMLGRTIGPHIEIHFAPQTETFYALADPAQVESAVLNLVLNGRDAMPGGGSLTIEVSRVPPASNLPAPAPASLVPGVSFVAISVTDSGTGISSEVLPHIFEPFFTTKGVGKGSGLGLSMIYGFAKQSGGEVTVSSEPQGGTTFCLYLPEADQRADVETQVNYESPGIKTGEAVLIVEDDDGLRSIAVRNVADLGYNVFAATNALEALSELEAHPEIDLLFTDIAMPGSMNGFDLAKRARERNPSIKILYTSGFPDTAYPDGHALDGAIPMLHKPYRRAALEKSLRKALETV